MEEKKVLNYWLHRIKGGDYALPIAYPLLYEHNYLSIGWSYLLEDMDSEDLVQLTKSDAGFEKAFRSQNSNESPARTRWNLYRFLYEMQDGDFVLVPSWGEFSIYKIKGNQILLPGELQIENLKDWNEHPVTISSNGFFSNSEGETVDLGFLREVTPFALHIPRYEYADQNLTSRMKIRQTNACISDLENSINNAIYAFNTKQPINLKNAILEECTPIVHQKIQELIQDSKFEELVSWYVKKLGASKVEIPSKNESPTENGDADVVAFWDSLHLAIMIQVKKHSGETDSWAVEQIKNFNTNHNYGDDMATQLWVISSCDKFGIDAVQIAQGSQVRLINGTEFSKMLLDVGFMDLVL